MDRSLFQDDDPAVRTRLYLRILYSADYLSYAKTMAEGDQDLPVLVLRLLKSIDFNIMAIEQAARGRNLSRHILRAAPSLEFALENEQLALLISEFTNSKMFWSAKGRSLAENFCFYVHCMQSAQLTNFQRDTIKACGIIAGISTESTQQSPWSTIEETASVIQGDRHSETFVSEFKLVDTAGQLSTSDNELLVREKIPSRIFIQRLSDWQVIAHSVSL